MDEALGAGLVRRVAKNFSDFDARKRLAIIEMNEAAHEWYRALCGADIDAIDYIESRAPVGYELCYAEPDGLGSVRYLRAHGYSDELILEGGIGVRTSAGEIVDRLRDRWVIPLRQGKSILGFCGRAIPRGNPDVPKYINPPTTVAFQKSNYLFGEVFSSGPIFLVEGHIDALRVASYFISSLAIQGSYLARGQLGIITHHAKPVIILMDGDEAGRAATVKIAQQLYDSSLNVAVILLAEEDPDSFLQTIALSGLRLLPQTNLKDWFAHRITNHYMKCKYDRTILDELSKPYVESNCQEKLYQFNVVDFCMKAYPEFAKELHDTSIAMRDDVEVLADGTKKLKAERVKAFLKAWIKPCREVRRFHKRFSGEDKFESERSSR